jgi:serine/threonine protein kinase
LSHLDHVGELLREHDLYDGPDAAGNPKPTGYVLVLRRYQPGDLYQWACKNGQYPLITVLNWTIQLLNTLADCNVRGGRGSRPLEGFMPAWFSRLGSPMPVIHCDISPPNLALEAVAGEFRIRILDFGIARYVRDATMMAATSQSIEFPRGRAFFASPEQLLQSDGSWLSRWTDVYSAFAVLHWLICGFAPWEAEWVKSRESGRDARNVALFIRRQWDLGNRPVRVDRLVPGIPPALGELVENMLDPSQTMRKIASGCSANAPDDEGVRAVADDLMQIARGLLASPERMLKVGPSVATAPSQLAVVHTFESVEPTEYTGERTASWSPDFAHPGDTTRDGPVADDALQHDNHASDLASSSPVLPFVGATPGSMRDGMAGPSSDTPESATFRNSALHGASHDGSFTDRADPVWADRSGGAVQSTVDSELRRARAGEAAAGRDGVEMGSIHRRLASWQTTARNRSFPRAIHRRSQMALPGAQN